MQDFNVEKQQTTNIMCQPFRQSVVPGPGPRWWDSARRVRFSFILITYSLGLLNKQKGKQKAETPVWPTRKEHRIGRTIPESDQRLTASSRKTRGKWVICAVELDGDCLSVIATYNGQHTYAGWPHGKGIQWQFSMGLVDLNLFLTITLSIPVKIFLKLGATLISDILCFV